MKKVKPIHAILIVVGVILLTFALYTPAYAWLEKQLTPVAVVIADTGKPRIYQLYFTWDGTANTGQIGTDQSKRSPIPPSKAGALYVVASDLPKEGSGLDTVTATVTAGTPSSLIFSRSNDWSLPPPGPDECDYSLWKATYTTPEVDTPIDITITVKDKAGNTKTQKFYATTAQPNGEFYINDQKVTVESIIYINTLTLNIKFKATSAGFSIQRVFYRVYNKDETVEYVHDEDLTETVADTEWTATYTLPAEGEYHVYGYFMLEDGRTFQKMFIGIDTGTEPIQPQMYYRFFLGLLGTIFIAYPIYDIYAEKKH